MFAPGASINTTCSFSHEFKGGPDMRARGKTSEQITAARLINEIGVPPTKTLRLRSSFARPRYKELGCENAVDLVDTFCRHRAGEYARLDDLIKVGVASAQCRADAAERSTPLTSSPSPKQRN